MRVQDLKYISRIDGVQADKVGSLLSTGSHHRVYFYGENQVMKVPRRRFNFLYSKRSHLESDLLLLEQHFPGLVIKTSVFSNADHTVHCIVQNRLTSFTKIYPDTVPQLQAQISSMLNKNARLFDEQRAALDLLGGEGFVSCINALIWRDASPYLSNMVVTMAAKKKQLRLLDSELIRLHAPMWKLDDVLRFILSWLYFLTMYITMRVVFKVDILPRRS